MTSNTVAGLLSDLGVTRSYSRPKVSNDNPYSESWFKTLKYALAFRNASHPSTTHEISWMNSSPGITTSIGTAGSVYTPRRCVLRPGRGEGHPAATGACRGPSMSPRPLQP